MSFWLNDLSVLIENYKEFFPKKNMNNINKANALMRFAIYYSFLLIILKLDTSWLTVSIILILFSILMGTSENFNSEQKTCTSPNKNNPYMNFILGDQITNPQRTKACDLDLKTRNEELKYFRKNINGNSTLDKYDLYSRNNNDREFYTMPSTTIVNNQKEFAHYLFGDFGRCKSEGKDCLKHVDNRFHRGRYYYQY
jgi:hypothetical protein